MQEDRDNEEEEIKAAKNDEDKWQLHDGLSAKPHKQSLLSCFLPACEMFLLQHKWLNE